MEMTKPPLFSKRKIIYTIFGLLICTSIALVAKPAISAYYSSKWLGAVLKELGWAKRKLDLTPQQQALWMDGENEFRQLLESMRGQRDKIRDLYERGEQDAEAGKDYEWVNDELLKLWYHQMDSHSKVVMRWHAFDQSLTIEQRKTFRSSMSDLVVKDWEHFSGRWYRYLTQHTSQAQGLFERVFRDPTPEDKELAARSFASMKEVTQQYEAKRKSSVRAVELLMQDPNQPLSDLNALAESNWKEYDAAMKNLLAQFREYFYEKNSRAQIFRDNKARLNATVFRKQREMTPPSYNNN